MQCQACSSTNFPEAKTCANCGKNLLTGTNSSPIEIDSKWHEARGKVFGNVGGMIGLLFFFALNNTVLQKMYLEEIYVVGAALATGFIFRVIFRFLGSRSY
jgi:hypothetical protein